MMSVKTILAVVEGDLKGTEFVFENHARCLVGRAPDCDIQLPAEVEHPDVSRRHCLFEMAPPHVWVGDLGSLNGTYVNGKKIGGRRRPSSPAVGRSSLFRRVELHDGDEVRICGNVFRVHLEAPAPIGVPEPAGMLWPT